MNESVGEKARPKPRSWRASLRFIYTELITAMLAGHWSNTYRIQKDYKITGIPFMNAFNVAMRATSFKTELEATS